MKTDLHLFGLACVLSLLVTGPGVAASEPSANPYIRAGVFDLKRWKESRKAPVSDRINDEALAEIKARHPIGYGKGFVPTEDPVLPHRSDFYAGTLVLRGDRGEHTAVPEKAVIHLPESLESRLLESPRGPFVPWPEFSRSNRSWLRALEVTVEQARGDDPLAEATRKQFDTQPMLVVGVYKGFPISVLSADPDEEDEDEEEEKDPGAASRAASNETAASRPGPRG